MNKGYLYWLPPLLFITLIVFVAVELDTHASTNVTWIEYEVVEKHRCDKRLHRYVCYLEIANDNEEDSQITHVVVDHPSDVRTGDFIELRCVSEESGSACNRSEVARCNKGYGAKIKR